MRLFVLVGAAILLTSAVVHNQTERLDAPREEYVLWIENQATEDAQIDDEILIYLKTDAGIQELPLEQYLVGVVMSEMPYEFSEEALKAQAVAARTYTLWKSMHNSAHMEADICMDFACCQTEDALKLGEG